ncbi:MAG: response regulator, partial [Myxococcota bacterium]
MSALSGAQPRSTQAKPDAPNILVVDDSSAARARVSDLLQKQGYSVNSVSSGEEAFSECFEQAYDLVVSDVTMGALSGVQLCRLLRNDPCTKDLPILLLTARDDPMSRFWGRHAGADSYIAKDRIQEELIDTVKRLLQGASGRVTTAPELSVPPSSPMTRLSEVLEENLFHAVLASEARSLQEHASSRKELSRAILRLAGELTCAAYIVVRLDGRPAPSYALLSRVPFTREPEHVSALGIPGEMTRAVDVIDSAEATIQDSAVAIGEAFNFPIVSGLEELGEIRFFGGLKRVSSSERQIGSLLAAEVASIAKNVLLVEETRRLADTCSLTGLANRRYVSERLDQELQRAERYGTPVSIALCDADHFK